MAQYRVIVGNLPKSILRLSLTENWRPIKDEIRLIRPQPPENTTPPPDWKPPLEPGRIDIDIPSGKALCPFKDKTEAIEAYRYFQGHRWFSASEGFEYVLVAWLLKWDTKGVPSTLAGPEAELSMPTCWSATPSSAVPTGAIHARQRPARTHQRDYGSLDPISDMGLTEVISGVCVSSSSLKYAEQPSGLQIADPYYRAVAGITPFNSLCSIRTGSSLQRQGQPSPDQLLTPALTSTSRNSSVSSISTTFLPSTPGSMAVPSISSSTSSSSTTLTEPRRPFPCLEVHKVRVYGVKDGVTEEQFHGDVLEKRFGIYFKHAGINIMTTAGRPHVYVGFHSKETAKKVVRELNRVSYMGRKLQAQLDQGCSGRQ